MVFDEHETRKCEVCQQPVMYGSRHHQCGTAVSGTPRTDAWEREFPNVRTDRASIVLSMVGAAGIPRLQAGEDVNSKDEKDPTRIMYFDLITAAPLVDAQP